MKHFAGLLILLGFTGMCFSAPFPAQSRFALMFFGGPNILDGGDINAAGRGFFDFFAAWEQSQGATIEGSFSPAKLGPNFGVELLYRLAERIGVGLGVETLSASKELKQRISRASSSADYTHIAKASHSARSLPSLSKETNPPIPRFPISGRPKSA